MNTEIRLPEGLRSLIESHSRALTWLAICTGSTWLLFDMTISSLTIPQTATRLFLLGFIVMLFTGSRIWLPWRWVPYIVLLAAVGFFSAIAADYTDYAMTHLYRYTSLLILGYCLFFFLVRKPRDYVPPILAGIVFAFLLVAPEVVSYLYPRIRAGGDEWVTELPHFGHIRHFGYQGFLATTAASVLAVSQPRWRWFWILMAFICLTITVWSGSRGATLSWMAFVGFSGVFLFAWKQCFRYWIVCGLLLAISTSALLMTPSSELVVEMAERSAPTSLNHITTGRLDFWRHAAPFILERPTLGYGPNGYLLLPGRWPGNAQPHNFLVQIGVEFGIFGGAIILAFFACFFRQLYRGVRLFRERQQDEFLHLGLMAWISAYFLFSLIDGLFYHALPLAHFAIISACAAALTFPDRRAGEDKASSLN